MSWHSLPWAIPSIRRLRFFFIVRGRSRLQQFPFEQLGQELCCVLS